MSEDQVITYVYSLQGSLQEMGFCSVTRHFYQTHQLGDPKKGSWGNQRANSHLLLTPHPVIRKTANLAFFFFKDQYSKKEGKEVGGSDKIRKK